MYYWLNKCFFKISPWNPFISRDALKDTSLGMSKGWGKKLI